MPRGYIHVIMCPLGCTILTNHFGPLRHVVCAGGPEVKVQHDDTIQHHHSDQNHDEHQVPVRTTPRFLRIFYMIKAAFILTTCSRGLTHLTISGTAMEVSGRRCDIRSRNTDWAKSTEMDRVIFSPPEQGKKQHPTKQDLRCY